MDTNTEQLIEKMALKLGTTAEHLWGVLIKQAPVSSAIDIASEVIAIGILLWILKKLLAIEPDESKVFDEFGKVICVILTALLLTMIATAVCGTLSTDIAGFTNPEYWALKQIIK